VLLGVQADRNHTPVSLDPPTTFMKPLESTVERVEDVQEGAMTKTVDKGKGKDFDRGRTLERGPRYPNPLAKAESRPRKGDPTIELDAQPIEKRQLSRSSTFSNFEDPNDPCAILEDNLLEPCPHLPICNSVSEVLSASESSIALPSRMIHGSTWSFFDTPTLSDPRPARTLTTVISNCYPVHPSPTLPPKNLPRVFPDIGRLEHLAITSSNPLWLTSGADSNGVSAAVSRPSAQASRLATEILQQIFYNLAPVDFNSARRTCRSWLIKSLNRSLLETMLRRAGFSNRVIPSGNQSDVVDDEISAEWLMSKSLALECALGPDWAGNGLTSDDDSGLVSSVFLKVWLPVPFSSLKYPWIS
jgi:hypothetical protein